MTDDRLTQPFVEKMRDAGLPQLAIDTFRLHLERLASGETGLLTRNRIDPVEQIPDATAFADHKPAGEAAAARTVVIKLNGGLGTSMGLDRAKSLLTVRDGLTFLDLIARQVLALRRASARVVPLVLMNSFRTDEESVAALRSHEGIEIEGVPLAFLQHKVPKVDVQQRVPASFPGDPELEWCPPGHGDLYTAMATSGMLDRLLDRGVEYAFVSNADNLGAVLDVSLLGYMDSENLDFMMEAARRTAADRKGGHLCRLTGDGRLALRESAQCPDEESDEFQDVDRYRFFNTNSIWIRLPALRKLLDDHRGVVPLPTIVNRKKVDPRDPRSTPVIQLETAMGAAISLFDRAAAVLVPRSRFSPVKTTNDLLGVRSDAYLLTPDARVVLDPDRDGPPSIDLDPAFFKLIDEFEARFPTGAPSLRRCLGLLVRGDVTFGRGVVVEGHVEIDARQPTRIDDGAVLRDLPPNDTV